jgi:hypothetical protein
LSAQNPAYRAVAGVSMQTLSHADRPERRREQPL